MRRRERRDSLLAFIGDRIKTRRDLFAHINPDDFSGVIGNKQARKLLFSMLEEEAGSSLLRDILKWIVENPEQFAALIKMLIGLFTSMS